MKLCKYMDLYHFVQQQSQSSTKISRRVLQKKIEELFSNNMEEKTKFLFHKSEKLDPKALRGFTYTEPAKTKQEDGSYDSFLAQRIYFSSKLNYCWERFVCIKEMMQIFDDESEKVDDISDFNKLIENSISFPAYFHENNQKIKSDERAFWLALACVCTESKRKEYKEKVCKAELSELEVAEQLKIPEEYVSNLLGESYEDFLQELPKS